MSPRRLISFLVLAGMAAVPRWVAAQPSSASTTTSMSESVARAEGFFKEGVRRLKEKKWIEAERIFEQAWALNPTVDIAYNLGTAEYQQGKHREAAEHLSFALRSWPLLSVMAGLRPLAEQRLAESRTRVGALSVKVNAEGAEVFVDGQRIGKAPLAGEVFVEPGTHTVEAKLQGYVSAKETVQAEKGTARAVEFRLMAPLPMEAKPEEKGGAGSAPGGAGGEGIAKEDGLRRTLIIAGIASSAAAITAGTVFAIISNGYATDANDQQAALFKEAGGRACEMPTMLAERCEQQRNSLGARDTYRDLAIWSFVAGGAVGIATTMYAIVSTEKKQASGVRVLPFSTVHAGGVVVAGEW